MAKAKVLIIEDNPDISGLLGIRLKRSDYDTAFAADAVTALTVARKERPDLIVLDLGLPGGDGHLVMERMKSIGPLAHVPVVVVSASDPVASEARVLADGAHTFMPKPIDLDRLFATIEDALAVPTGA